jgi:adenosine kinase
MSSSHLNTVSEADVVSIGIVSPDGREGMIEHANQFADANIPFIFDPSQGLPMFEKNELIRFIEQAAWLTVNDYEWQLIQERTGLSPKEVSDRVDGLIITLGGEGAHIYTKEKRYEIPPVHTEILKDPTGCGDAFRAGLLYGLMNSMDWETTGRMASLMGMINIEENGTQNHTFTMEEFREWFKESFKRTM